MEILTDIAISEKESQIYKKFKNLSVNEAPRPQGEGTIRISPFDDYFIFTLYDEIDGVDSPIDLSNVGTIYIVFIGKNNEIRIPNYTNVQDINMSTGQVLFRIGKDDSQKILALDNKNFYISTMMIDPDGQSDESVIYTGTFLSFEESAKASLTERLETARLEYVKQLGQLQSTIDLLNQDIEKKDNIISHHVAIIEGLKESNQSLANEIGVLSENLTSTEADRLLQQSKEIQKAVEDAKLVRQQIQSIKQVQLVEQTKSKKKAFFIQAASQLRSNIPGVNQVSTSNGDINSTR